MDQRSTTPHKASPSPPTPEDHSNQEAQTSVHLADDVQAVNSAAPALVPTPAQPPIPASSDSTATTSPAPSVPHPAAGSTPERPLNVSDALGYLDEVKTRFQDRPDVYNHFLDIMKDFKSQALTTPGVIERVSTLFRGHPELISGFNTFLPPGYRIECSSGDNQLITVTTPTGTLTQNAAGSLTLQHPRSATLPIRTLERPRSRDADADVHMTEKELRPSTDNPKKELLSRPSTPLPPRSHAPTPQPPTQLTQPQSQPQPPLQIPHLEPAQPQPVPAPAAHPVHIALPPQNPAISGVVIPVLPNPLVLTPSVALNSNSTTASAASVLGGMHRVTSNPEPVQQPAHPPAALHPSLPQAQPPLSNPAQLVTPGPPPGSGLQPQPQPEFYHAIQYINRIKTRFADEPETYKQFLEILQTYQKEQRLLHDVYTQVTQLFRGAPDLIDEFKMFLPDISANAAVTPGMLPPVNFVDTSVVGPGGTVGVMGMLGQSGTPGPTTGHPVGTGQSGTTEWTMEVQSVNVKGDKTTSYRRKVAGSDQHREGPPVKKRRRVPERESRADKEKERDRERENMPAVPMTKTTSRTKKSKHLSVKPSEPSSPTFTQYGRAPSPTGAPHISGHLSMHPPPSLSSLSQASLHPPPPPRAPSPPVVSALPEVFFDRVKRTLDDRDAWEEFLKLLSLFSTDVIEVPMLLQLAAPFLGGQGSELESQFRDILGLNRVRKNSTGEVPKAAGHAHGYGHPTGMGTAYLSGSKHRYGPSYRRLPDSETTLACSGRDELCRSVLNDDWVSHPTWASEESGFVAHKKNSYEEALHKSEEERHEYHVHLESMAHTISLLEPIAFKIGDMTPEDRAVFRLTPDLGGQSRSIHQKIIKRVYGRENAQEVLQSLQDNPAVAVPVVLDRLKQVDAEWRKNKREWEKVWREVDSRNFYKSLDHQGVAFKANDKKAITGKALLAEIERIKEEQDKKRNQEEDAALEGDQDTPQERIKRSQVPPRHQLEYDMHDEAVLQDALKLTLCFLERNDQRQSGSNVPQYNAVERRRIEAFLRHYVMHQFGLGPEFDAAFGPPIDQAEWEDLGLYIADGDEESFEEEETSRKSRKSGKRSGGSGPNGAVSAGDLKKKLNKTRKTMEKAPGFKTTGTSKANSGSNSSYHRSPLSSRQGSPVPQTSDATSPTRGGGAEDERAAKDNGKAREADLDDIWLRHVELVIPGQEPKDVAGTNGMDIDPSPGTRQNAGTKSLGSFFCNTTFYTLLRLLQLLYSRLMVCKSLAAKLAMDGSTSFLPNPVALDLGLTDTAGPSGYFADLASGPGPDSAALNPAEHFYLHLLDLVEKVFDGELEQTTFEENMRFMFGTRAFVVFTLDKLCAAICKQVQAVVQDFRCHELMSMLEQQRARDTEVHTKRGPDAAVAGIQDVIRYRRQAEALVGTDENLFRVDWRTDTGFLRIQLLDADDLSLDPPPPEAGVRGEQQGVAEAVNSRMTMRWRQYVLSYVLSYPTEGRRIGAGRKIFLKKTLLDEDADELAETRWRTDVDVSPGGGKVGLEVMVGPGTCKLYYARGSEEAAWRVKEVGTVRGNVASGGASEGAEGETETGGGGGGGGSGTGSGRRRRRDRGRRSRRRRSSPEEEAEVQEEEEDGGGGTGGEWERLRERAEARQRERRRWIVQFEQGLLF